MPLPDGAITLDAANIETSHNALYCRFDLFGQALVDRRVGQTTATALK